MNNNGLAILTSFQANHHQDGSGGAVLRASETLDEKGAISHKMKRKGNKGRVRELKALTGLAAKAIPGKTGGPWASFTVCKALVSL